MPSTSIIHSFSNKKPKMNSSSSSSRSKKNTQEHHEHADDFDVVKEYLMQCPHLPRDNPAIKCAMYAIEKEQQRRIRDAKLQAKFGTATTAAAENSAAANNAANGNSISSTLSDADVVVVEKNMGDSNNNDVDIHTKDFTGEDDDHDSMEWQDVQEHTEDDDDDGNGDPIVAQEGSEFMESKNDSSYLGKELAKVTIESIAEHRVHVSSPLGAIAAALHASLRSSLLGFACTGIPDDPKTTGGFAAPVRELPKTQFLPLSWEEDPHYISLRYRKKGTGALVLKVCDNDDESSTVKVTLGPANNKESPARSMTFSMSDHINLDSWSAALKANTNTKIAPSLHYKGLSGLLSNFCQSFDLGVVIDSEDAAMELPYVDNTVVYGRSGVEPPNMKPSMVARPSPSDPPGVQPVLPLRGEVRAGVEWKEGRVPSTLDQAFPDARRQPFPGGDFADDLLPAGLQDPCFMRGGRGQGMGGNLTGPNHPLFSGDGFGGVDGPPRGGPGSMQPRFDPVHPPGIDDGSSSSGRGRRQKPSRTGEPNPDHLPPPGNMFL